MSTLEFNNNTDTSSVESMVGMFSNCPDIIELDLSSFVFKDGVNLTNMFFNSVKLEHVYLKNQDDVDLMKESSTGVKDVSIFTIKE